ncbi:MAG: Maf family protein [Hyphomicrobiaceae bacterium]|nr:Maf family protein [Hyphomicrobiaceae bacterium]
MMTTRHLILASGSKARYAMLKSAGLAFTVDPADIDEAALKARMMSSEPAPGPESIALELARAKGRSVSARHPGGLVVAADQVLSLDGDLVSKPADLAAARSSLLRLRGRTHQLTSAVVMAEAGEVTWQATDTARLTMRAFSDAFLDDYLVRAGPDVCWSVGAYELEGLGIQLFDAVDGDYFTILGLPLLPLLSELRQRGAIAS